MLRTPLVGELMATARGGLTEDFLFKAGVEHRDRLDADAKRAYRAPHPDRASRAGVLAFPREVPLDGASPVAELACATEEVLRREFRDRPAQICWGMRDVLFGEDVLDMWRETLPAAQVTRLEDAGHYVQEDAHERVIPELLGLLAA
jgi:haloalkane dehalogenase